MPRKKTQEPTKELPRIIVAEAWVQGPAGGLDEFVASLLPKGWDLHDEDLVEVHLEDRQAYLVRPLPVDPEKLPGQLFRLVRSGVLSPVTDGVSRKEWEVQLALLAPEVALGHSQPESAADSAVTPAPQPPIPSKSGSGGPKGPARLFLMP
jgi:hypothetical protein